MRARLDRREVGEELRDGWTGRPGGLVRLGGLQAGDGLDVAALKVGPALGPFEERERLTH